MFKAKKSRDEVCGARRWVRNGVEMKGMALVAICGLAGFGFGVASAGCATSGASDDSVRVNAEAIARPSDVPTPPFAFDTDDEKMLEEVQKGAFMFLWKEGNATTGMVPDRLKNPKVVSVAGVGFQLSGIPIGIERGWITRADGEARTKQILNALTKDPQIVKGGLYQHFLDADTAGLHTDTLEHVVSTIDSALLFCGVLTSSAYFGGEIAKQADGIFERADFTFFLGDANEKDELKRGFVSLGWRPTSLKDASGAGNMLPYYWVDSGCEHRLVTFLGVCAPDEKRRLEASTYYRLRRTLGEYEGAGKMVWFPYSGALFVNQFSHCWINYSAIGVDDPQAFGFEPSKRASVDWWENARRITKLHQLKAVEASSRFKTLGENAWGLSASDCPRGYCVPGVFPKAVAMPGATLRTDYAVEKPKDDFGDGTVAPYAAGTSIMFDPQRSLAALKHYRSLKDAKTGQPLVWRDPDSEGKHRYGFVDAFNLDVGWVADDFVSIDQGPLLLAIENARTGMVWRLFHSHRWVQDGMSRLKLDMKGKEQGK